MARDQSEYVLGTGDAELARLGFQHQVWARATAGAWEHAGFRRGATILDVGCGPGYATFDLADLVGAEGRVIGVDMSPKFIAHVRNEAARRGIAHVDTRVEELGALAQPPESVDGAFARWVMCFLPDPGRVIARVAEALRPGAAFAVVDYSHYEAFRFGPPSRAAERIFRAVGDSFRAHGGNPDVGMEIPAHMARAGLEVRGIRSLTRIGRPGTALWEWPRTFFRIFLPTLVDAGSLTHADVEAFWADYEARSADPAGFFVSPPMIEVVGVKPGAA